MATATAIASVGNSDGDMPLEMLRACYEAFAERRLCRGAKSIRTRQGYASLCGKYHPRLRFFQDVSTNGATIRDAGDNMLIKRKGKAHARYRDEGDKGGDADYRVLTPLSHKAVAVESSSDMGKQVLAGADHIDTLESDSVVYELKQLVGVFSDPRITRFLVETMWPLAHHGGGSTHTDSDQSATSTKSRQVPEWQELDQHKYFAFTFQTLLWLFPGLPSFEVQALTEWDWSKDCEFDSYGNDGLSLEGFMVSMFDLALACTDGSVGKCLEFLTHLAKRLDDSLPIFHMPTTEVLPRPVEELRDTASVPAVTNRSDQIVWKMISHERLTPCLLRKRPQFLELKVKLSVAPVVLMFVPENDRPLELQLSTSAKLLVRENDQRSCTQRSTSETNALSHYIENEKQSLWTFRSFPAQPTLVVIPSRLISKRSLTLYGCCRQRESHEVSLDQDHGNGSAAKPLLSMFSTVQEPFPLSFGAANSLCGRIDRQNSRLFVVDHRSHDAKSFKIEFKTSTIRNTSSSGGSSAASVLISLAKFSSAGTSRCTSDLVGVGNPSSCQSTPHSFIFVVKLTSDILKNGPPQRRDCRVDAAKRASPTSEASVPTQWYTTLSGANENKTIYVDTSSEANQPPHADDSLTGVYHVYVFTLNGFYFEAVCEDAKEEVQTPSVNEARLDSPPSGVTNPDADTAHSALEATPKSIVYTSTSDDIDVNIQVKLQGDSIDAIDAAKSMVSSVISSAALLRQLLRLRKQHQLRATAQPPPEYVGGSKLTNIKALATAAGLRAKFLKARAEERRTRFLQYEDELRSKVLHKLLKAESKRRVLRGSSVEWEHQQPLANTATPRTSTIPADLESKATLLVNFFKEMAAYQPTQRELDVCNVHVDQEGDHVRSEKELLENFADLFQDDHALQNMVDEEKWMTVDEKTTKRQTLLKERVRSPRSSLNALRKQQVLQLHDQSDNFDKACDRKRNIWSRASEDYDNTAKLIHQLMHEAANEENDQTQRIANENDKSEAEHLEQITASWTYAAQSVIRGEGEEISDVPHSTRSPSPTGIQQDAVIPELRELENFRREHWYSSHHVHDLAKNERLQQQHATLRPTFVPPRQSFQQQEEDLPWQPIWEVQVSARGDRANEMVGGLPRDARLQRRRRPMTADGAVCSPRPPSSSGKQRDRASAVQAAVLARHHTHRLKSAQLKPFEPQTSAVTTPRPLEGEDAASHQSTRSMVTHLPPVFMREPYGAGANENLDTEPPLSAIADSAAIMNEPSQSVAADIVPGNFGKAAIDMSPPTATSLKIKPSRMKKKTKLTKEEKRLSGRVRELLSISPLLQSFAQTESR